MDCSRGFLGVLTLSCLLFSTNCFAQNSIANFGQNLFSYLDSDAGASGCTGPGTDELDALITELCEPYVFRVSPVPSEDPLNSLRNELNPYVPELICTCRDLLLGFSY